MAIKPGALVLYKLKPARVAAVADRIELELPDAKRKRVRDKDVALLHEGPFGAFDTLVMPTGNLAEAWELLQGESASLRELAELLFGDYTPAAAWSAYLTLIDDCYFHGDLTTIQTHPQAHVEQLAATRAADAARAERFDAFLQRLQAHSVLAEDVELLDDVAKLAQGRGMHSEVMAALNRKQDAETAQRLLLDVGYWSGTDNPHPLRAGASLAAADVPLDAAGDIPRLDLTHLPAFAIDDEGSNDPDDALSLEGDRLWIHVADVASIVAPDSAADVLARQRGANLYLPERAVGMLPEAATQRCGLGLQEESPALSIGVRLDASGTPFDIQIAHTRIRVTRTSYDAVNGQLDEAPFKQLRDFVAPFSARRRQAGAAFIDLPEARIRVSDGTVSIRPLPRNASRQFVTEAMLLAGEAVALYAQEHCIPLSFSTQPPPEVLQTPASAAESFAYRKTLKRSQMKINAEPHAGTGLAAYVQSTSPLRRYMDLVAHQQLAAHLAGRALLSHDDILQRIGEVEGAIRATRRAESDSNRHWTLVYLQQHPDWQGEAVIVERNERRVTAIIPALAFETRLPAAGRYQPDDVVQLALTGVDLPSLTATFNVSPVS